MRDDETPIGCGEYDSTVELACALAEASGLSYEGALAIVAGVGAGGR